MGVGLMAAGARHPGMMTRLAVLVTALVLGGAAPALAQSAASEDDPYDPPPVPGAIDVVKTATPSSVPEPGGDVRFDVVVFHDAPDAGPVAITALVDDVHGDLDGRGTCAVPQTIAPGHAYTCAFTAYVGGDPGFTETDTVTAVGTDANGDPLSDRDNATVTVVDVPSVLRVDKVASRTVVPEAGEEVTFDVTVTNDSIVDTVIVEAVTDTVFGDVGGSCAVALPHALDPSEFFTCTFDGFVAGVVGQPHVNVVTASGTDDDGVSVEASDDATVDFEAEPMIDLELEQSFDPAEVDVDAATTLTVVVTNQGPADATGVEVTEVLPEGVTYVRDDATTYDSASGVWTIGSLPNGGSATLAITVIVDEAGAHVAVAEVTAADQTDVDSTPADGEGDDWDDATVVATEVLGSASLGDTVWIDTNTNGRMDDGEAGFAGVRIRVTTPDGAQLWKTTTSSGFYRFVGLAPGEYLVKVMRPEGWASTTAVSMTVTLDQGDVYLNADFGLAQGLPNTGGELEAFAWLGALLTTIGVGLLAADRKRRPIEIPAR